MLGYTYYHAYLLTSFGGMCIILCHEIQRNSNVQSWIKSIDICSLSSNNEVMANWEHPKTRDKKAANQFKEYSYC